MWGVNLGVIDWNPWPVRRADLDHPDELRVDLDPGPEVPFSEVREVALAVREVLDEHDLCGFPKTSGSRGIHVYVRIAPEHGFEEVRRAALALAREVERRMPGRATSRWWKEEREGVFIDYNQNARDRTVASAYSVRAVPDARVSCPLHWDEVADVEPERLTLKTVPARLRERGDPSAGIDERVGAPRRPARARRPRRARGSRRRPLAAALPQAEGRAQARAAEPRASHAGRRVSLPLAPPVKPQLALSRKELPVGDDYCYEIKLDGFRCLAFVDNPVDAVGDDVFLQSRNGKPLRRYFPELLFPAGQYVLDGEIVVRGADGREDFDALGQRIHPAASRIERLAGETPARYVAFDLLARGRDSLLELAFAERRAALESLLAGDARVAGDGLAPGSSFDGTPVELMPTVDTPEEARQWLEHAEGAIAKERSAPYRPGERKGMVKVKRVHTIDAVLVGWRPGKEPDTVGALILGLYDGEELRVVGHCSGLSVAEKRRLVGFLAPYETGERGSGDPSRWSAGRDLEWIGLRPELVVEIDFDHVSAGRIRHGAKLRRWRDDKPPRECAFEQLFA